MLSDKEVKKVASLARISLADNEVVKFQKELSSILDYVETLNKADTSQVEPLYQTSGITTAWREDQPSRMLQPNEVDALLISQAPQEEKRQIKVKSVISR